MSVGTFQNKLMKNLLLIAALCFSLANAETLDPPTFYWELNSSPLTVNETVSSNILNASGLHSIHLTEAPGTQADWTVDWYLDDKTTVFASNSFLNQGSTADVNSRLPVLSNWARIYVYPASTRTTSAVVYGSWGSEQ